MTVQRTIATLKAQTGMKRGRPDIFNASGRISWLAASVILAESNRWRGLCCRRLTAGPF